MIRFRYTRSAGACYAYFLRDAKLSLEERTGRWIGQACAALGVSSGTLIDPRAFSLGLDGYMANGRRFVRLEPPPGRRRAAYDIVIAPSKSVSIAGLVAPPPLASRVQQCFIEAARDGFALVEGMLRRQAKVWKREWTGTAAAVEFTHTVSRYGDPHLHNHYVALNVTQDRRGELWAMTVESAMACADWIDRLFQIDLARRLSRAGFASRLSPKGICELPVSEVLVGRFSKGRSEIDRAMMKIQEGLVDLSPKRRGALRQIVNDRVRPRKGLRGDWSEESKEANGDGFGAIQGGGVAVGPAVDRKRLVSLSERVRAAEDPWAAMLDLVGSEPGVTGLAIAQEFGVGRPRVPARRVEDHRLEAARKAFMGVRVAPETGPRPRQRL